MKPTKRKLKVVVDGEVYEVEVDRSTEGRVDVWVNGRAYQIEIEELTGVAGAARPTSVGEPPPAKPREVSASPRADQVSAPMPGDIIDVFVQPGDQVVTGQDLCVLEAMKMKNLIRSPRAGRVASVQVSPGQSVAYGDTLVKFG